MQTTIEKQALDMRRFYDFDRYDIDFLAEVILFTKVDISSAPSTNQVVITAPGTRI